MATQLAGGSSHRAASGSRLRRPTRVEVFSEETAEVGSESGSDAEGSEGENGNESTEREYHDALPPRADIKGKAPMRPGATRSDDLRTKKSSWTDLDLSVIVALVSPIGNWLTGGDHIKNLFLIILLIFYLHQIIEIPWQLYLGARPRKSARRVVEQAEDERIAKFTALAQSELQWHEISYLALAILSPVVGAIFLRHVLFALGDHDALSWFSTTLFVLATGIRPWSHLITRLKDRTGNLHTVMHCPDEDSLVRIYEQTEDKLDTALKRVDYLERELRELREAVKRCERLREVCDDLTEILGDVERAAKRNERKADASRAAQSVRLTALEQGLIQVEDRRKRDIAVLEAGGARLPYETFFFLKQAWSSLVALFDRFLSIPRTVLVLGLGDPYDGGEHKDLNVASNGYTNGNGTFHTRVRSPDREKHVAHLVPRLATIPEAEDSDSEETFVGDRDALSPSTAGPVSPQKAVKSRGDVNGQLERTHKMTPTTAGHAAFDRVEDVMLWPYRFSVRVLVAVLPPMKRIVPRV